jgi:hypothetical protein
MEYFEKRLLQGSGSGIANWGDDLTTEDITQADIDEDPNTNTDTVLDATKPDDQWGNTEDDEEELKEVETAGWDTAWEETQPADINDKSVFQAEIEINKELKLVYSREPANLPLTTFKMTEGAPCMDSMIQV